MKLSEKRKAFADFFMGEAQGNGTRAATMAGYASPASEACRLLRDAKVRAYIDERQAKVSSKRILTAEEMQARLTEIALAKDASYADVVRAIKQLSRMTGADAPKKVDYRELRDSPRRVLLQRLEALAEKLRNDEDDDG